MVTAVRQIVDVKQLKHSIFKSPYFSKNLTVSRISYSVSGNPEKKTFWNCNLPPPLMRNNRKCRDRIQKKILCAAAEKYSFNNVPHRKSWESPPPRGFPRDPLLEHEALAGPAPHSQQRTSREPVNTVGAV